MDLMLNILIVVALGFAFLFWWMGKKALTQLVVLYSPSEKIIKSFASTEFSRIKALFNSPIIRLIAIIMALIGAIGSIYLLIIGQTLFALGLAIFSLILFFFGYLVSAHAPPYIGSGYYGKLLLPKRVYEGNSQNISIELKPAVWVADSASHSLKLEETGDSKSIHLEFKQDMTQEQFLEIEFLGAGVSVDGEKRQKHSLGSNILSFVWSCYFPNSGYHSIAFIIRLLGSSKIVELGSIQHTVKVVKFLGLTQRQIWILATMAGIFSGFLAIAQALRQLGVW